MKSLKHLFCQFFSVSHIFYCFVILAIIIFYGAFCLAEDEPLETYTLEEIEKDLLNQNSAVAVEKIEREDLQKLEDKKKESISSEVNVSEDDKEFSYKPSAKIVVLNKITAKSELIKLKIGATKVFGNISVEVHKCAKNINPLKSSNLMLITVFDNKIDNDKLLAFHGWMDSSNVSISTMEHPVYEILPIDCVD